MGSLLCSEAHKFDAEIAVVIIPHGTRCFENSIKAPGIFFSALVFAKLTLIHARPPREESVVNDRFFSLTMHITRLCTSLK